eukprot:TRINITY_DN9939_c0_g1_i1.p1 TRINITY_DN9939_c0_g1~~TRINITY_DN9939_c0_g1_i1.p1  ORF type:complete len:330 (+),score=76.98 TRINITY_DN9939_c0_g1_i1:112-990(+)
MKVSGSHVVVTGGSSGIGLTLASMLAEKGAHVTIIARNPQKLLDALNHIQSFRANDDQIILQYSADVTDYSAVQAALEEAANTHNGKIDALICSAGDTRPESFDDIDPGMIDHLSNVNYLGVAYCTKAVLPYMQKQDHGRIIYVSSILGLMGFTTYGPYCATKFAIRGLAEALHMEYARWNIKFSLATPGNVDTPMFEEEEKYKPESTKILEEDSVLVQPEVVAQAIINCLEKWRFLVSSDMDTYFISCVKGGFGPASFEEVLPQVLVAPILRMVTMGYRYSWKKTLSRFKN